MVKFQEGGVALNTRVFANLLPIGLLLCLKHYVSSVQVSPSTSGGAPSCWESADSTALGLTGHMYLGYNGQIPGGWGASKLLPIGLLLCLKHYVSSVEVSPSTSGSLRDAGNQQTLQG